jgi:hypothetical protein
VNTGSRSTTQHTIMDELPASPIRHSCYLSEKEDSVYTTTRTFREYWKNLSTGKYEVEDTAVIVTSVVPVYKPDTITISFGDIKVMRKGWFKGDRWLEPFGWVIVGCVVGVAALPVAAIEDGKRGVRDWATAEGVALGVSIPIVLLGNGETKYNLTKKWSLKAR